MTDFVAFAHAHGVVISRLDCSGKIRRCPTVEHPRSKNGAYAFDGQRGFVWAWDGEARAIPFGGSGDWSDAERAQWVARRMAAQTRQVDGWERAAHRAIEMLKTTRPGQHGYLMRKGLPDVRGLCLPDGALFVPMRHLTTNALQGAQLIRWIPEEMRWDKKMIPGMRAKGAVLRIGAHQARETILCEGYATGLSIEAAARHLRLSIAVLVCFSDSNMVHVAPMVKGPCYVFADHDASGAGLRAAKATGLPYCMSGVEGDDANDMHKHDGLLAVCSKLMDVRAMERAPVA